MRLSSIRARRYIFLFSIPNCNTMLFSHSCVFSNARQSKGVPLGTPLDCRLNLISDPDGHDHREANFITSSCCLVILWWNVEIWLLYRESTLSGIPYGRLKELWGQKWINLHKRFGASKPGNEEVTENISHLYLNNHQTVGCMWDPFPELVEYTAVTFLTFLCLVQATWIFKIDQILRRGGGELASATYRMCCVA